jgi:hypothetical protein
MKKTKQETPAAEEESLRAEARAVLAKRSLKRSRFLDAALSSGPKIEPIGRLAG